MDVLNDKSDLDLYRSLLAEIAKSKAEIATVENDIKKIKGRLSFLIVLANELIDRVED